MNVDSIIDKVIPSLLLGAIFGLFSVHTDLQETKIKLRYHLSESKIYNEKQWDYIVESHDDIIKLKKDRECDGRK